MLAPLTSTMQIWRKQNVKRINCVGFFNSDYLVYAPAVLLSYPDGLEMVETHFNAGSPRWPGAARGLMRIMLGGRFTCIFNFEKKSSECAKVEIVCTCIARPSMHCTRTGLLSQYARVLSSSYRPVWRNESWTKRKNNSLQTNQASKIWTSLARSQFKVQKDCWRSTDEMISRHERNIPTSLRCNCWFVSNIKQFPAEKSTLSRKYKTA